MLMVLTMHAYSISYLCYLYSFTLAVEFDMDYDATEIPTVMKYTIRLPHDIASFGSWFTELNIFPWLGLGPSRIK